MYILKLLTLQTAVVNSSMRESYEPAIFYHDEEQKAAELKIQQLNEEGIFKNLL